MYTVFMQLKKWWTATTKFFSTNAIYLLHAYLFAFIAALAVVWLVLQASMAKEVVFILNTLIFIFVYATTFSLFIFILEYVYSVRKIKKNAFQQKMIFYLFAIVNFFLAALLRYLIFWVVPPVVTELEMKIRFQNSLEGINITGYHYFHSTSYDVWLKTNQKIELELSQVKLNRFYSDEQFYIRRVGSVKFFTPNCYNDLDMGNKDLVKLLLGREVENPSELIHIFSQSTGFEVAQRLEYFQQFDSVTLQGITHKCPKISINDFRTRTHAYGPAYVTPLNNSIMVVEYSDTDSSIVSIVDTKTLKHITSYEGKRGELEVLKSPGHENIFIVNRSERTITSLHSGSGQILTYNIPSGIIFYPVGLVSRSGYVLMNFDGRPTLIGPRFSRSRQTTILDRLSVL